jgi:D-tyrosyl-tRNA(Tyr) deacylase
MLLISSICAHAASLDLIAAAPDVSIPLYHQFVGTLAANLEKNVETGEFGAHMIVRLTNDGPVTIIIDSKNRDL